MTEKYLAKIAAILGVSIEDGEISLRLQWDTVPEARQHIKRINQMKKEVRLVKKSVRSEMKDIRASFREKKADVKAGLLPSMFRGGASRDRAMKREALRREERTALGPHESVLFIIDSALVNLDRLKIELQDWIAENK